MAIMGSDRKKHNIHELFLATTNQCNLNCTYCSANANSAGYNFLNVDVAVTEVERWIETSSIGRLSVVFTGGEPLLWGLDNIGILSRKARLMAKEKSILLHIGIQTNGLLIDHPFIVLCKELNIEPSISLDGPPEIHDRHRSDGEGTMRGLKILQEAAVPFAIITCLTREVAVNIVEILEWYRSNFFLKVRINIVGAISYPRENEFLNAGEILNVKKAIFNHVVKYRDSGVQEYNVLRQIRAVKQMFANQKVTKNYCDMFNCGAGLNVAALNPDGRYCLCIEKSMSDGLPIVLSFSEMEDAGRSLFSAATEWDECRNCYSKIICDQGCPVYYKFDKNLFSENCEANKYFWKFLIGQIDSIISL